MRPRPAIVESATHALGGKYGFNRIPETPTREWSIHIRRSIAGAGQRFDVEPILWWLNQDAPRESLLQCDAIPCG